MTTVLLRRLCKVRGPAGTRNLAINVQKLKTTKDKEVIAEIFIECDYFSHSFETYGVDAIQAVTCGLSTALSFLKDKGAEGFQIWWLAEGDIDRFDDFWRYV